MGISTRSQVGVLVDDVAALTSNVRRRKQAYSLDAPNVFERMSAVFSFEHELYDLQQTLSEAVGLGKIGERERSNLSLELSVVLPALIEDLKDPECARTPDSRLVESRPGYAVTAVDDVALAVGPGRAEVARQILAPVRIFQVLPFSSLEKPYPLPDKPGISCRLAILESWPSARLRDWLPSVSRTICSWRARWFWGLRVLKS
jgi:hypothetical protein